MSSRLIVLNEWVLHDLAGDNGGQRQRQANSLLDKFDGASNLLAVPADSQWMQKLWRLATSPMEAARVCGRKLREIVLDPDRRCLVGKAEVCLLAPELAAKLPRKDIYLVETYRAAKADLLVTEDARLLAALHAHCPDVTVQTRDDFMRALGVCP